MTLRTSTSLLGPGEIRCLTGLRGCAALLVMVYHFTLALPAGTMPLQRVFANGYLWVDLFFVLSGFVLAYGQQGLFTGAYSMPAHVWFLLSRLARVYPLYGVVILESAVLLAVRAGHVGASTLGLNLAMLQGWGLAPSLEGAAWSVSTEWAAYLLFPLLLGATVLGARWLAVVAGLAAAAVLAHLAQAAGPFTLPDQGRHGPLDLYSSATIAPLWRCLAEFSLGLLSYRVANHLAGLLRRGVWRPGTAGALAVAVAGLIVALLSLHGWDLTVVALFCALLVVLSQQRGRLAAMLAAPAPYQLGRWSYSIYLIHDKFTHPAQQLRGVLAARVPFASGLTVLLAGAAVVGCSALTFVLVEQPLRRAMMQVLQRVPAPRRPHASLAPARLPPVPLTAAASAPAARPPVSFPGLEAEA